MPWKGAQSRSWLKSDWLWYSPPLPPMFFVAIKVHKFPHPIRVGAHLVSGELSKQRWTKWLKQWRHLWRWKRNSWQFVWSSEFWVLSSQKACEYRILTAFWIRNLISPTTCHTPLTTPRGPKSWTATSSIAQNAAEKPPLCIPPSGFWSAPSSTPSWPHEHQA